MNPYPWMKFYVTDFENDDKVAVMSTLALGAYMRLFCRAWHQTPPGTLPNDDVLLAQLARLTPDEWAKVRPEVVACFRPVKADRGTRLVQKRMVREYQAVATKTNEATKKGRKAAEGRWGPPKQTSRKLNAGEGIDACALHKHSTGNANTESESEKYNNTAAAPPGGVVVVTPAAGGEADPAPAPAPPPEPDPVAAGYLRGAGVSDAVADDLARTTPPGRVSELIEAGRRRVARGQIAADQLGGFVVAGIRDGFVVQGLEAAKPPDERVRSAVSGAAKAKAERTAEADRVAAAERADVARLSALPPDRLDALKAAALAGANEFNRGRLAKADPLTNPTLRSMVVGLLAAAG